MIFISYSWADAATVARKIHSGLKSEGHVTWIDYERLDLNGCLEIQLRDAINSAETFLFIDSPKARQSSWIRFELDCAKRAGVRLVSLPTELDDEFQIGEVRL